jgi:hypothetical protein
MGEGLPGKAESGKHEAKYTSIKAVLCESLATNQFTMSMVEYAVDSPIDCHAIVTVMLIVRIKD